MRGKKGLSQIVTTILIILIILVAIGIIWGIVYNVIIKGTNSISLGQFTLDLKIVSAKVNYSTGIAEVKVVRNTGEGELKSIKFIVEDDLNSDVFEVDASTFKELATRTFFLDLTTSDILDLENVKKISIAPVYIEYGGSSGGSTEGKEILGRVSDSVGGLDEIGSGSGGGSGDSVLTCSIDSDCGEDSWIEGSSYCSGMNIMQGYRTYSCLGGVVCINETDIIVNRTCSVGEYCYDSQCLLEASNCVNDSDCGTDGFSGPAYCNNDNTGVLRDVINYSCASLSGTCSSTLTSVSIEDCAPGEICEDGSCFIPVECSQRIDPNCDLGEVCDLDTGTCVPEEIVFSGTVNSAWPYGSGEYFDSLDLPLNKDINIVGYYVIFPGSSENRCIVISGHYLPTFEGGISYVRLNTIPNSVANGDDFEIWETNYICSTL